MKPPRKYDVNKFLHILEIIRCAISIDKKEFSVSLTLVSTAKKEFSGIKPCEAVRRKWPS